MSGLSPFPFKRPTPVTAAALVDWFEAIMRDGQEAHLRRFGALEYAKALADGGTLEKELRLPGEDIATSIQISAGDYAVMRTWRRTKIVYDVDPTLMRSLAEMDTTDVLPGDIMRQLPHPNPMFVFTDGHPVLHKDGVPGVIRAMTVTGRRADNTMCSTHDEEATNYQLTFNADLLNDDGKVKDLDSVRISFDLADTSFTINKLVDSIIDGYAWEPLLRHNTTEEKKRQYLVNLAKFGIAHLLYVCSDKADAERRPVGRKPTKKGQRPPKPLQMHQLGYRVGPAIKAAQVRYIKQTKTDASTGRSVAPHIRRAHLHTFAHGKGRALRKVKWLPPIFVNSNGDQFTAEGTIVRVTS
ncbi:hypothetical protein [Streptomyces luteogriseus]|uniref:hypothetical protein n=1 Tax=Streptomyces luteogriseus TaxID=68233 RepID=UPI00378C7692